MTDLINGRTPEEIKRILVENRYDCDDECRSDEPCNCPYIDDCKCGAVANVPKSLIYDALSYIERLETEHDAALAYMKGSRICVLCAHWETRIDEPCMHCTFENNCFEWRGTKPPEVKNEF